MVAEDTPANQKLIQLVLQMRGHEVHIASDGAQAVARLQNSDFDVVIMDVEMPEMDGFQATQALRALSDPRKARLPIIAMMDQAEAMAKAAHRLKGTVFYLAAQPVLDSLNAVEQRARQGTVREARDLLAELEERVAVLKENLAEHRQTPVKS